MRGAVQALALVTILCAIVAVRVVWSSRGEWQAANAASGDERIVHLGRAARLYAPGNPYSRRAIDALATIGRGGEPEPGGSAGANGRALAAWRELRSAILATRSFYTPHRALLDEANGRIAELMADAELAAGRLRARDAQARDQARAWHAARLAQDEAPSLAWTLLALLGLAAWIGCAVGLLLRGVGDDDRLRPRVALAWAAGVAAGLALFFVALARA